MNKKRGIEDILCFDINRNHRICPKSLYYCIPNQAKSHHVNSPSTTFPNLPSSKILVYFSLNLLSKIAYIFAYYNSESVVGKLGVE